MPDEIITKTSEQIIEDYAILAHCIVDPQAWIDNAIANNLEFAIQEKIEKNRQDYLNEKYLSITVDEKTGIEIRTENPDYLNRAERDALEELKRDPLYNKTLDETAAIIKTRINAECQSTILARFPIIHQLDVANGLYPDRGMKQWIADMIIESNRCHELIDTLVAAQAIIDDVKAVIPTWPIYEEVN